MATAQDSERCIRELNGTRLHGNAITVEPYSKRQAVVEKALVSAPTPTLWITGIAPDTKAAGLKKLFLAHGRVVASTIVMSKNTGHMKRFGLVKMSSVEEADLCIQKLNNTELDGRVITVDRAKANALPEVKSPVSAGSQSTSEPKASAPSPKDPSSAKKSTPSDSLGKRTVQPMSMRGNGNFGGRLRGRRGPGFGARTGGRVQKRNVVVPSLTSLKLDRGRHVMRMHQEQQLKAKQAELVQVLALECDRRRQQEEADRLAFEREQLEIEKMRLERERIEGERLRLQVEQERRQNEREQMERERNRNQMLRDQQRMGGLKRLNEGGDDDWDYMAKRGARSGEMGGTSPMATGRHSIGGTEPGIMYEGTNLRLQQMASGQNRRLVDNRMMKDSVPSLGSSANQMGGIGRRSLQGPSFYQQTSSSSTTGGGSYDSVSKSEWKSLYNMSTVGSGGTQDGSGANGSQWRSLASSSSAASNANSFSGQHLYQPSSSSSYGGGGGRERQFPSDVGSGFRMKSQGNVRGGGFKGFGGRGGSGNRWR